MPYIDPGWFLLGALFALVLGLHKAGAAAYAYRLGERTGELVRQLLRGKLGR